MQELLKVYTETSSRFKKDFSDRYYHVFLFEGEGKIWIDLAEYDFNGKTALFTSPYQNIKIESSFEIPVNIIDFHGDFYCIEYHKKEVACNGLLFNNIYLHPNVPLETEAFEELSEILQKIKSINTKADFSEAVARSYLQLILAISSREKSRILNSGQLQHTDLQQTKIFQQLVEENFLLERSPAFYAGLMHISPNALSKKIKSQFNKTPTQIIQERVILEAKKQIHLTRKSIKEIAGELNFADEYYFRKYFKKNTDVSPTQFREEVGISVVADL